jgi:hypothetical protein
MAKPAHSKGLLLQVFHVRASVRRDELQWCRNAVSRLHMRYDPRKRPPSNICPERYCFFWMAPGDRADISGGPYSSLEEALREATLTPFPEGGCSCRFGICTRLSAATGRQVHRPPPSRQHFPVENIRDWYEPCEPALERDGLPDDYFVTDAKDA